MRILFVPTKHPDKQGDLLEVSLFHGLRSILGENFVDYPKKKIMYHDFSDTQKHTLHGRGFSYLTHPVMDLTDKQRNLQVGFDVTLYGDGHMYGEGRIFEIEKYSNNNVWVIDGHDLHGHAPRKILHNGDEVIGVQYKKCFKRELVEDNQELVYPTGFGIPVHRIRSISFNNKKQLFQKTAPDNSMFNMVTDVGGGFSHHRFQSEEDYYNDIQQSWFGLTCKKGGWDCMRHYEIIAAGTVLLFRDYDKKHSLCSPQKLPCLSYSSKEELETIMNRLVINNTPTEEYIYWLHEQRKWLYSYGTTEARALNIVKVLREHLKLN